MSTTDATVTIPVMRDVIVQVSGTNAGVGGSITLRAFGGSRAEANDKLLALCEGLARGVSEAAGDEVRAVRDSIWEAAGGSVSAESVAPIEEPRPTPAKVPIQDGPRVARP
jgi:hypothetical protein